MRQRWIKYGTGRIRASWSTLEAYPVVVFHPDIDQPAAHAECDSLVSTPKARELSAPLTATVVHDTNFLFAALSAD